ncbi:flagellar hook protein [Nocardioides albidus]|uniref:Flagellin n=1 Tax=Nocardioides albidus TaxID=1517589 RepID=A0A5C4W7T6_9ACTN|nr:flagellin [Nocardioides albidus]TNM44218.1 flagellar hook protein [Nocardioides albidus]
MTIGRVTQRMMSEGSLANLQRGLGRMASLQEQLSTGRVINRPSDNPTGTTAAMRIRTSVADQGQYALNAQDGIGWLTQVDNSLAAVTSSVRQARDLALQGANSGAMGQQARDALAIEVDGIREQLLGESNASYLQRPVFGGVTGAGRAYDDSGTWVGVAGQVNRRVADDVVVQVDVDGRTVFGDGAGSVFAELAALSTALRAGDTTAVRASVDVLRTRESTVTGVRAAAGSRYQRLEQSQQAAADASMSLANGLSSIENADLAETTMHLKVQEVAYQAALAATSRVIQPSLLDFLR